MGLFGTRVAEATSEGSTAVTVQGASDEVVGFWESIQSGIEHTTKSQVLAVIIVALLIIILTAVVSHILTKAIKHILNRDDSRLPYSSIFVNISRTVVWSIGISLVLSVCFKIDVTGMVAALGVGGIALSLGMQDTISNIIGGLQLNVLHMVNPGDFVEIGTTRGLVKDINWRHTVIQGVTGETTIIPNSTMVNSAVVLNASWCKVKVQIDIPFEALAYYEQEGKDIEAFSHELTEAVRQRLTSPAPEGLGLTLTDEVKLQMRQCGEYAYLAYVVARVEDSDREIDRLAIEDAIVRASVPFVNKGRL